MNNRLLLTLGIGLTALFLTLKRKVRAGTNLITTPLDIGIDASKTNWLTGTIGLRLKVRFTNNESASVVVNKFDVNISLNNTRIGKIVSTAPFTILGKSSKEVTFSTTIQILNIITMNNLKELILGESAAIIKAAGTIDTDLGTIGFGYEKKIN